MNVNGRNVAVEHKALVLLTAKPSMRRRLIEESTRFGSTLLQRMESNSKCVNVIARLTRDPFALTSKLRGHDVTIELRADADLPAFTDAIAAAGDHLPSTSTDPVVLIGRDLLFRPCGPQAVRFQYLMRRRQDLTVEDFARHYREVHSEFGYQTRGVQGYAQFHVDPGLGTSEFDGVSQLYMPGLTRFLLASPLNGAQGMIKDEKRFVDRDNSVMSASRVIATLGSAS
jgi:hypothetical protein